MPCPTTPSLTVASLAEAKKLPVAFLRQLGLTDLPGERGGVAIPYYDETGFELAAKRRTTLRAKDGSYWPKGKALSAYGRWKIHEALAKSRLFLVEGESDCWALWHHDLPALGLPGCSTAQVLTAELCEGIETLYIHLEPDDGGRTFERVLLRRLVDLNFAGRVFFFRMPVGCKDPADLHVSNPDGFLASLEIALQAARPASLGLVRTAERGSRSDAANAAQRPAPGYEPDTIALGAVVTESVAWLWPGRIPLGKLTILDGDPGLGKSSLALDLAARVTCGLPMPHAEPSTALPPADVLLLSAEDGLGDTIRPRLEAAGAQLDRITAFNSMKVPVSVPGRAEVHLVVRPVALPFDLPALEKVIAEKQAKFVIIDPLMAYLDESVQAHNDQSVRRALMPLCQMAERQKVAVLVVRHLNKQPGRNVIYRGGGSIGIIGAVRSGLIVCKDPHAPHQRLLGVTKCNLCKPPKTLRYELTEGEPAARVSWLDEADLDMDTAFVTREDHDPGAGAEAEDFLRKRLAHGEAPAAEVLAEAEEMHISEITLRRAQANLGIQKRFEKPFGPFPGKWLWSLPAVGADRSPEARATESRRR